jgi:flagellar protein FlaF
MASAKPAVAVIRQPYLYFCCCLVLLSTGLPLKERRKMQSAANAYSETAMNGLSPREAEAAALMKSANQLQAAKEKWNDDQGEVANALYFNRQLWILLTSAVADKENPLPLEIRNNVGSLGSFVFRQTMDIEANPEAEKLDDLISINRQLAAGLQGNA